MNTHYSESLSVLRAVMRSLRDRTPARDFSATHAAASDIRTGYIEGRPVKRLVVTLRAPGCTWVTRGGGCTMCGHYAGTTHGSILSVDNTVSQFVSETERYDLNEIEVISVYNSGSMLNPAEIHFEALKRICTYISRQPSIKKIVLETRAEFVTRDALERLYDTLRYDQRISVAIGLETADDVKRDLCMNKGCSVDEIERTVESIRDMANVQLYILLGLPFLTEKEMIDDAVGTIRRAHAMGASEIHIEPATLQKHTLAWYLAERGLYRLPSLYSLYEVLRGVVPEITPYVSPFLHMPLPEKIPEGCPRCTGRLISGLLERYNLERTRQSLETEPCDCMTSWKKRLEITDPRSIEKRAEDMLGVLAEELSAAHR